MVHTIKRMYAQFSLLVTRGGEQVTIDYLIGVHQGDNLAPLLFVLVFQPAMESLKTTEERKKISVPTYCFPPDTTRWLPRGQLSSQNTQLKGTNASH